MKRLYLVVVSGLCSFAPAVAQEGTLAPTAPVVPAPVVQNGTVVPPPGGGSWGTNPSRAFAVNKWSPFRNPATAGDQVSAPPAPPVPVATVSPAYHGAPATPVGASCADGSCGPGGCARPHSGACWDKFKRWLCFHPTKTDLPTCHPTPYYTSLQAIFPCSSGGSCCAGCAGANVPPGSAQPADPSVPPTPAGSPMAPMKVGSLYPATTWGSSVTRVGTMPPRNTQGGAQSGSAGPVIASYTATTAPAPTTFPGPVMNAFATVPQK